MKHLIALTLLLAACSEPEIKHVYYNCLIQVPSAWSDRKAAYEIMVVGNGYYEVTGSISGSLVFHEIGKDAVIKVFAPSSETFFCINVNKLKGEEPLISLKRIL
jgi:hypothetical protein